MSEIPWWKTIQPKNKTRAKPPHKNGKEKRKDKFRHIFFYQTGFKRISRGNSLFTTGIK